MDSLDFRSVKPQLRRSAGCSWDAVGRDQVAVKQPMLSTSREMVRKKDGRRSWRLHGTPHLFMDCWATSWVDQECLGKT